MARTSTATKGKRVGATRKAPARKPVTARAKTDKPAAAKPSAAKPIGRPAAKSAPAPKVSKDELRAQVSKLERTVSALRAKNKELTKAAKHPGEAKSETAPKRVAKTATPKAAAPKLGAKRGRKPKVAEKVETGVTPQEPTGAEAEA